MKISVSKMATFQPFVVISWQLHRYVFIGSKAMAFRDVSAGATGATVVAPTFSDTLTLSQPGGADSAHDRRGRT